MKMLSYWTNFAIASLLLVGISVQICCSQIEKLQHFHGYQVLRVNPSNQKQVDALFHVQKHWTRLEFWTDVVMQQNRTDVMVSSEDLQAFKALLGQNHIEYFVMIENVESIIEQQRKTHYDEIRVNPKMSWYTYHDYQVIMDWMEEMKEQYNTLVSTQVIGKSTEGRDIKLMKISTGNPDGNKPSIFLDGMFHSNEWASPATVTYFIKDLLENSQEHKDILDNLDLHIVPMVNPDGYVFSRNVNRMWRKTRSNHSSPHGCLGVDPNRNFEHMFGAAGSSSDKCTNFYHGPAPFSEPETAAIKNYLLDHSNFASWKLYVTVHTYGQYILIPWSYGPEFPEDFTEMEALALNSVRPLTAMYGTQYTVGQSALTLGVTAGCSDDWAKEKGIKYAYTFELRDTGRYGFLLPPEQIIPTAKETTAALKEMIRSFVPKN